jgi:quinol monooxygenase YgiN
MAYVVAATYRAKVGEEERIASILRTVAPLSRKEPGCRIYQVHRSTDDSRIFFLYEQYRDEAAYRAHQATKHFQHHVRDDALPRLETRERAFFETLD